MVHELAQHPLASPITPDLNAFRGRIYEYDIQTDAKTFDLAMRTFIFNDQTHMDRNDPSGLEWEFFRSTRRRKIDDHIPRHHHPNKR